MSQRKRARWKAKLRKQQSDEQRDPDSPIHSARADDQLLVPLDACLLPAIIGAPDS